MSWHEDETVGSIHIFYDAEYDDTTARDSDTTWNGDEGNVGKAVKVGTNPEAPIFYILATTAPIWITITTSVTQSLSGTLATGNTSGGTDIVVETGDLITITDAPASGTDGVNMTYADSGDLAKTNVELEATRTISGENSNSLEIDIFDLTTTDFNDQASLAINETAITVEYAAGNGAGGVTGTKSLNVGDSGIIFTDTDASKGPENAADYSANFTDRSLVDKEYADNTPTTLANMSTGQRSGDPITLASTTTLSIPAGTGWVIHYAIPTAPVLAQVSWDAVAGYAPTNLAIPGEYAIYIDDAGGINEIAVNSVTNVLLSNNIFIGAYSTTGSIIVAVVDSPANLGYDGAATVRGFLRDIIGPATIDGNIIGTNGVNLSLDNSGGDIFLLGSNFHNDPELPDQRTVSPASPMSFGRILRIGTGLDVKFDGTGLQTVVSPNQWDDGSGTLATVPINDFTVQVVYIGASGQYGVAYGQEVFNSMNEAESAVRDGTLSYEEGATLTRSVRRAWLIVKRGTTDLTVVGNAQLIAEGKFRLAGSSTSSAAGVATPGGATTNVQFNDGGLFGGDSGFVYSGAGSATLTETLTAKAGVFNQTGNANLFDLNGTGNTTTDLMRVDADALTTGSIARFSSASADTSERSLIKIINSNSAAVTTHLLDLQQNAAASTFLLDVVDTGGSGILITHSNARGLSISVASGQTWIQGGLRMTDTSVTTATYSTVGNDQILLVNRSGVVTVTLSTADTQSGRTILVKDASGAASTNNITIDTEGAQTIDGNASRIINGDYDSLELYCDGSNWHRIRRFKAV